MPAHGPCAGRPPPTPIQPRLQNPQIPPTPQVRETSRRPFLAGSRGKAPEKTAEEVRRDFSDIVLAPQVGIGILGLLI